MATKIGDKLKRVIAVEAVAWVQSIDKSVAAGAAAASATVSTKKE